MKSRKDAVHQELLVLRARRGDRAALDELIRKWERPLFYFVRRLVHEEADSWDVLQETWLHVISGIGRLRDSHRLAAWLYRIARNTAFRHGRLRALYRAAVKAKADLVTAESPPSDVLYDNAEEIHHALGQLPLHHREVITLQLLEQFSVAEIAVITGASEGTVKSRLHYARRSLRAMMAGKDQDDRETT